MLNKPLPSLETFLKSKSSFNLDFIQNDTITSLCMKMILDETTPTVAYEWKFNEFCYESDSLGGKNYIFRSKQTLFPPLLHLRVVIVARSLVDMLNKQTKIYRFPRSFYSDLFHVLTFFPFEPSFEGGDNFLFPLDLKYFLKKKYEI